MNKWIKEEKSMKFKRNVKFDSGQTKFEVGDTFTFKMKDGEKVKVRAVKEDANGNMLFIFEDCLKDKYTMNRILNDGVLDKIFKKIPKKIRKMLVAFDNGEYLRLPTEKEIFGVNVYGEEEDESITQFECMKKRKHRIAFKGYGTDTWDWYWLDNRHKSSTSYFTGVNSRGLSNYENASYDYGVRPLFCIKNL